MKPLQGTTRSILSFLAIVFLIVAIFISLARALTPLFNEHKDDFEKWAQEVVGRPIVIGSVHAQFVDFEPVFDFHNVTVLTKDRQRSLFHLNNLSIGINFLSSIANLKFITGHITLSGLHISVRQGKNGEWILNDQQVAKSNTLPGTPSSSQDKNAYDMSDETYNVLNWILAQNRIKLQDIYIRWYRNQGHDIIIPDLDVSLINSGNLHRLRGSAEVGFGEKARLNVGADITGNLDQRNQLQGTLYIGGDELPMVDWLNNANVFGMKLKEGYCDVQVWADIAGGTLSNIQTQFDIHHFIFDNAGKSIDIPLFSGNVIWNQLPNSGWSIVGNNLKFQFSNHKPIVNQFIIQSDAPLTSAAMQRVQIEHIRLDELSWFLQEMTFVPKNMKDLWKKLKVSGSVHQVQFMHQGDLGELLSHLPNDLHQQILSSPWLTKSLHLDAIKKANAALLGDIYFHTDFNSLSWQALPNGLPEVQNITGSLIGNLQRGYLTIDTEKGSLYLPNVFEHMLTFDDIQGTVQWQHIDDDLQVKILGMKLKNDLLRINTNATIDVLSKNNVQVNWVTQLAEKDLTQIKTILPVKIMGTNLRNWLTNAFVAGDSLTSTIVFRGPIASFPFDHAEGQFLADSQLKNVILHFAPDWPSITQWNAHLLFNNNSMHVETESGKIWIWPLVLTTADIPYLTGNNPTNLYVHAKANVTSDKAVEFTQITPLVKTLSGLKQLDITGPSALDLHLLVPLSEDKDVSVDGDLLLSKNNLTMPKWKVDLQGIDGLLHFTENGVSSKQLTGTMYGYPTTVQLNTIEDKQKGSITRVDFDSQMDIAKLKTLFDIDLLNRFAGSLKYHGTVDIPTKADTSVMITSTMEGVSLFAPPPYGKKVQETRSLKLVINFPDTPDSDLWIYYARLVSAHLLLNDGNLKAADIALGGSLFNKLPAKGIDVHGYIPAINWDEWKTYADVGSSTDKTSGSDSKKNSNATESDGLHINQIKVNVGKIKLLQQTLSNAFLDMVQEPNSWIVNVKSDKIIGKITWPDDFPKTRLVARLDRLYIQTNLPETPMTQSTTQASSAPKAAAGSKDKVLFSIFDIPPLDVDAKDFRYNKSNIGGIKIQVTPISQGLRIDHLKIYSDLVDLSLAGTWLSQKDEVKEQTNLAGTAAFKNLGKALYQWDVTKKLRGGQGDAVFTINWPAAPYAITVDGMQGNIHIEMKNGAVVNLGVATDAKIGVGKVLNLLSFQSILRRLSLNFNDISTSGYSYDIFRGDFKILDGHISTNNTYVDGPVAQLKMHGGVNAKSKNYDLIINMSPHLTSSLPVVATIIGGPIAGAATFVANELVSPEIETAVGETFLLTGNWDNPEITPLKGKTAKEEKTILQNSDELTNLNQQALAKQLDQKANAAPVSPEVAKPLSGVQTNR